MILMVVGGIFNEIQKSKDKASMERLISPKTPFAFPANNVEIPSSNHEIKNTEIDQLNLQHSELVKKALKAHQDGLISFNSMNESITASKLEISRKKDISDTKERKIYLRTTLPIAHGASGNAAPLINEITPRKNNVEFNASQKYITSNGASGIAIDRERRKIALITPLSMEIIDYSQIVSSEVFIDSDTTISTSTAGLVARGAVGAALTGGFGAIVLAMGAKKKQQKDIKKIELNVLTKGTQKHNHRMTFYESPDLNIAAVAMEKAAEWHDILSVAISEAKSANDGPRPPSSNRSITDELQLLIKLKGEGFLSDSEFTRAKDALF